MLKLSMQCTRISQSHKESNPQSMWVRESEESAPKGVSSVQNVQESLHTPGCGVYIEGIQKSNHYVQNLSSLCFRGQSDVMMPDSPSFIPNGYMSNHCVSEPAVFKFADSPPYNGRTIRRSIKISTRARDSVPAEKWTADTPSLWAGQSAVHEHGALRAGFFSE
jgi:hypothetical protein